MVSAHANFLQKLIGVKFPHTAEDLPQVFSYSGTRNFQQYRVTHTKWY